MPIFRLSFDVCQATVPWLDSSCPKHTLPSPKISMSRPRYCLRLTVLPPGKMRQKAITWGPNTNDLSGWNTSQHKWILLKVQTSLLISTGPHDIRVTITCIDIHPFDLCRVNSFCKPIFLQFTQFLSVCFRGQVNRAFSGASTCVTSISPFLEHLSAWTPCAASPVILPLFKCSDHPRFLHDFSTVY